MVRGVGLRARAVGALLAAAAAAPACAQTPAAPPSWIAPTLTYDGTLGADAHGGLRTGRAYIGNLHLKLSIDGNAHGWDGTTAFLDVLNIHGGSLGRLAGDAQGVSNIEGPDGTQIEELWVQRSFGTSGVSLLAGIYDLNSEFDRLPSAGLFLNSAFGVGTEFAQSGVEGPSIFPRTSAGLRLTWRPRATVALRAALLDGVPVARPDGSRAVFARGDGALGVAEIAFSSQRSPGAPGAVRTQDRLRRFSRLARSEDTLAIGVWHYTTEFPDVSELKADGRPVLHQGSSGVYVAGEQLWLGTAEGSGQRLAAFAQGGLADPRTNRFGARLGAGLVGSGWGFIGQSTQVGASVTRVRNGSHYRRLSDTALDTPKSRDETTVELTCLSTLTGWLSLQPDLQYIRHPGASAALHDAWVLQMRFELSF